MQMVAQTHSMLVPSSSTADLFVWGGVLLVLLVVLWLVWLWLRKWFFGTNDDESSLELWSLSDLKRMREQGDLTEEEYATLREQALAAYRDSDEPADAD